MNEYAAAAGIMTRLAQQAAPQSRANTKLQKNKQKVLTFAPHHIWQQYFLAGLEAYFKLIPLSVDRNCLHGADSLHC